MSKVVHRILCALVVTWSTWSIWTPIDSAAYLTRADVLSPVNYFIFMPPEAGESYIDPTFGTTIRRVSSALGMPNAADTGNLVAITNEYSTVSPFNRDNSRLLVQHQSYFALYDENGNYIRDLPFEITAASEPRWSRHDPNLLYYVTGNQLKQYNIATGISSVVRVFAEYTRVQGKGESDLSADGDHFVLAGDDRYIFVYQLSTDTKGPALDTGGLGSFDNVHITPGNNVLVSWLTAGQGPYRGVELYDRHMTFIRQVTPVIAPHMDVARDINGDEVLLFSNAADPAPVCQNGVVKTRLADGQQTCLISLNAGLAVHVSAADQDGWVLLSTYAPGDPTPASGWARYTNEILQVRLDGSEVRRLAHHRSRPFNAYWWTPRAAVSRDGSRVVYSSNSGLQAILGYPSEYSDVYLIDLSSLAPSVPGSDRPVGTRFEQDHPAVSYSGTWYGNTFVKHSGGSAALAVAPGARATFTFTGTAARWIAYRDEWSGIGRVYVDGTPVAEVDTYASPFAAQVVMFRISGLPPALHTLTIEATGKNNPPSGGAWVWVDAFEVVRRLEQDDPTLSYSCPLYSTWYSNSYAGHSKGSAVLAVNPGCQTTLTFVGTAVSWIGYRDEWAGSARVYVDGRLRAEIDTYASPFQAQARIYTISGLPPGEHMVTIEATGRRNTFAGGAWIWVDAFELSP